MSEDYAISLHVHVYRSTSDPDIGEELQRHIEAPYFIPPGLSHLDLSWIFMGAPGPGASIHVNSSALVVVTTIMTLYHLWLFQNWEEG